VLFETITIFSVIVTQSTPLLSVSIIEIARVKTLAFPARSPNLNAYAAQWISSAKEQCLSKVILLGERSLRRPVHEDVAHYDSERNHQETSNVLPFPRITETRGEGTVRCRERLGGLLRYYHKNAACAAIKMRTRPRFCFTDASRAATRDRS
jgi:hypothetical protein